MKLCFLVKKEHVNALMDNQFDELVLKNTGTGANVPIEITAMDMSEILLLGDDADSDVKLA